jgi:hypothetical protein
MLRSDPAAWFAAGCPMLAVPTVEQALDAFGGRRILTVGSEERGGRAGAGRLIRDRA